MQEFTSFKARPKLPFLWPGSINLAKLNPIPHRYRPSRRRSRQKQRESYSGTSDVTALQTSFNVLDSVRAIRRHRWSISDIQYVALAGFLIFSLAITPPAPVIKTLVIIGTLLVLFMPITRQFFLPSLPIWTYLTYFFCSRFIPAEYRPHIWVRVLPALENVLYGANLSNILSAHTHAVLDVLAWFPYGIGHFGAPAICSLILFVFAAPGTTPLFAKTFGWMSILGVTMQLVFPCTPPWYENEHGLAPAAYGMPGSPAGLARVDKIFGVDMYTTSFTTAPLPFGAFPSLHAADALLEALFMSYCFPRLRPLFIGYVGWIWWATMYLSHHYAVDLVGGSLIAAGIFYGVKARYMPQRQPGKSTRWEYEYVDIGESKRVPDLEGDGLYGMGLLRRVTGDSDEWTMGSSSSFSSSGSLSPTLPDDSPRSAFVVELTPNGSVWNGDKARESDLNEVMVVR